MTQERDALGSELEVTRSRMDQLQQQTTQMMRDRSTLNAEINALKDQLAAKVKIGPVRCAGWVSALIRNENVC